jgi:thioredoxin 1
MEYQFTKSNFQDEVLNSKQPVLVDFYADWCGPCRSMFPVVEQLANEYDGRAKVGRVNSDMEPELTASFGVSGIPSFFILKDGKVVDHFVGAVPKAEIARRIDAQL